MERVWIVVLTSLSLISLLLAIVGLISPNWVNYYNLHPISRGLWEICKYENCSSIPPESIDSHLRVVQALQFLVCAALLYGFLSGVLLLRKKTNPGAFVLAFSVAGASNLVSLIVYSTFTAMDNQASYGYSYKFSWAACAICFVSTLISEFLMSYNR